MRDREKIREKTRQQNDWATVELLLLYVQIELNFYIFWGEKRASTQS